MRITEEEAKQDLSDYFSCIRNSQSNYHLNKAIEIEQKYEMYGGTPEIVSAEISKYINQGDSK